MTALRVGYLVVFKWIQSRSYLMAQDESAEDIARELMNLPPHYAEILLSVLGSAPRGPRSPAVQASLRMFCFAIQERANAYRNNVPLARTQIENGSIVNIRAMLRMDKDELVVPTCSTFVDKYVGEARCVRRATRVAEPDWFQEWRSQRGLASP